MATILKRIFVVCLIAVVSMGGLFGCSYTPDTDDNAAIQVERSVASVIEKHGVPSIVNGRDYQTAVEIYELRDQADFATYTYVKDEDDGGLVCVARSLGYPMPASVQIANPEKEDGWVTNYGYLVLPQAEANGLFMPQGLDATYQRVIDPNTGEAVLGYFEDKLNVYPFEVPGAKRPCSAIYGG